MSKGFTLLELMIVVAVIGILAAVSYPGYQAYFARVEIEEILVSKLPQFIAVEAECALEKSGCETVKDSAAIDGAEDYNGGVFTFNEIIRNDKPVVIKKYIASVNNGRIKWDCYAETYDEDWIPTHCKDAEP